MACGPFTVGQGSHTADCGYFCAYVVMLANGPGGYSSGDMAEADVYAERDAFRQSRGLRPGRYFLAVNDMAAFLGFLGQTGYGAYANSQTPHYPYTVDGFKTRIQNAVSRGGVILLLERQGSVAGHYIAVLGMENNQFCCYDPMRPALSGLVDPDVFARSFFSFTTHLINR